MSFSVTEAGSLREYLQTWKRAMQTTPRFRERRLFDYRPEELMEDIKQAFQKSNNFFLIAKQQEKQKAVGVLGVTVTNSLGMLGRWEPIVTSKHRHSKIAEMLLKEAFSRLQQRGVTEVRCMLKFPISQRQTARWHSELYKKCGFSERSPCSIMLLADLSKVARKPSKIANLQITDGNDFSSREFADFTQRAYMSMPEDREVHMNDPFISDPKTCLSTLQAIREGKMGFSPAEFWLVAKLNNNIAGFIIGFMSKRSKYRPAHGVIGELGVFPEHRRKGVATALISEMFKSFHRLGCKYSLVGTLKTNKSAIALYKKAGFYPVFELVDFEKTLVESTQSL